MENIITMEQCQQNQQNDQTQKWQTYLYAFQRINTVVQRQYAKIFVYGLKQNLLRYKQMYHYVKMDNQKRIYQFVNADKVGCDSKGNAIGADQEAKPQPVRFQNLVVKNKVAQKLKKKAHRTSDFKQPNHFNSLKCKRQHEADHFISTLVPLWDQFNSESQLPSEDEEIVSMIRQRRTRRQRFKTRMFQNSQRKPLNGKQNKLKRQAKSKANDKFYYCPHFVDMEVTVEDQNKQNSIDKQNKSKRNSRFKSNRQVQSLNTSPKKTVSHHRESSLFCTSRKWQPLVEQKRQFVLQNCDSMKPYPGISKNADGSSSLSTHIPTNSNNTRKKLQFLKNNQLDSVKIKLSQLMSYKRLGTSNQLAYCSSMRTVKPFKENSGTQLSISSKHMLSQHDINSRKLIKIANKKVYEELVIDENENNDHLRKSRSKTKLKKSGKVRFGAEL